MLPDHGTTARYRRQCRCDLCRRANTRYDLNRRIDMLRGAERTISPVGLRRRIEALQRIGYSLADIAEAGGWRSEQAVHRMLIRERTTIKTAVRIADVFERLCMTPGPSPRAARVAEKRGYHPPLAWDLIDDPNERPTTITRETAWEDTVDHAVVWRVINGQPRPRQLTRAESAQVVRTLLSRGISTTAIERDYGLKAERYERLGESA